MKKELGITDIFFPAPAALIVSGSISKEINIATVAWVGMVSSTPPTIGISLDKRRYSLGLIRDSKEFTVNIPSAEYYKETDFCGLVSGKRVNKLVETGLTPVKSNRIQTPILQECPFNLECRLIDEKELGDYILLFGEIVETQIDADKVGLQNDRIHIDIAKVNPLVYCATIREYWELGQKVGDAFCAGKDLITK